MLFQSTHPCRVRHNEVNIPGTEYNFNPRTRVGCDLTGDNIYNAVAISIHAPV